MGVSVGIGVSVGKGVSDAVSVAVWVGVNVIVGVSVAVGVLVDVGVGDCNDSRNATVGLRPSTATPTTNNNTPRPSTIRHMSLSNPLGIHYLLTEHGVFFLCDGAEFAQAIQPLELFDDVDVD